MRIVTEYVCPPIPYRDFDWRAYDGDTYDPESNQPVGWGATKEWAIADLLRQLEEANDDGA
jgi:hypothetical protein